MGGGNKSVTTGYKYFMGALFGVCRGPVDAVTKIRVGENEAWSGNVTTNTTISINKPELFGGVKREGGVKGSVDIQFGGSTQPRNSTLAQNLSADVTAFRGVLTLVFKDFYWSAMNPYFKPVWITVRRVLAGWGRGAAWYSSKAAIGADDINPVHIIYQCVTDPIWGMGYTPDDIDETSFQAAADQLYTENFGLSLVWAEQTTIEEFIKMIIEHIDAAFWLDPQTAKFKIELVRGGYDINTLPLLDEDNCKVITFERVAWGETANEITVTYTDRNQNKQSVTVHDIAAVAAQGGTIPQTRDYPGIRDAELAARVAQRDLNVVCSSLAKVTLEVDRTAWNWYVGKVFRLTWPRYGLSNVPFRIVEISKGTLENGAIRIDAIEDIFGLPSSAYLAPQAGGWVDPINNPQAVSLTKMVEASYWEVGLTKGQSVVADLGPDFGMVEIFARKPTLDSYNYLINYSATSGGTYQEVASGEFTPYAQLAADVAELTTSISLSNAYDLTPDSFTPGLNHYAYIDDEVVEITTLDFSSLTATIRRGCLDTTPRKHSAGAAIWFSDGTQEGFDFTERVGGEQVFYKLLTTTGRGTLPLSSASVQNITMAQRYQRPYPPAQMRVNSTYFPAASLSGDLVLTWVGRDRTQQTVDLVDFTQANIGPEAGTDVRLRVYDDLGTLTGESAAITSPYTFTSSLERSYLNGYDAPKIRIGLASFVTATGLSSWQDAITEVTRTRNAVVVGATGAVARVTTASVTATIPTQVLAGDWLYAFYQAESGVTPTTPTGWDFVQTGIYRRFAAPGDAGGSLTLTGSASASKELVVLALRHSTGAPYFLYDIQVGSVPHLGSTPELSSDHAGSLGLHVLRWGSVLGGSTPTSISFGSGNRRTPASAVAMRQAIGVQTIDTGQKKGLTSITVAPTQTVSAISLAFGDALPSLATNDEVWQYPSQTVRVNGTSISASLPATVKIGFLLTAWVSHRASLTSVPSGWTLVATIANPAGGFTVNLSVYQKVATYDDIYSPITFGAASSNPMNLVVCAMLNTRGADVGIITNVTQALDETVPVSSGVVQISAPSPNDYTNRRTRAYLGTAVDTNSLLDVPVGETTYASVHQPADPYGTNIRHLALLQGSMFASNPSVATLTGFSSSAHRASVSMAVGRENPVPAAARPISHGSVRANTENTNYVEMPAGIAVADRAVIVVLHDAAITTPPSGWTLLTSSSNAVSGGTMVLSVYHRVVDSASLGGTVFSMTFASAAYSAAQVIVFRHLDALALSAIDNDQASTDSSTYAIAAGTAAVAAGQLGVGIVAWKNTNGASNVTVAPPSGYVLYSPAAAPGIRLAIGIKRLGSSESVAGNFSVNVAGANDQCAISFVIGTT